MAINGSKLDRPQINLNTELFRPVVQSAAGTAPAPLLSCPLDRPPSRRVLEEERGGSVPFWYLSKKNEPRFLSCTRQKNIVDFRFPASRSRLTLSSEIREEEGRSSRRSSSSNCCSNSSQVDTRCCNRPLPPPLPPPPPRQRSSCCRRRSTRCRRWCRRRQRRRLRWSSRCSNSSLRPGSGTHTPTVQSRRRNNSSSSSRPLLLQPLLPPHPPRQTGTPLRHPRELASETVAATAAAAVPRPPPLSLTP